MIDLTNISIDIVTVLLKYLLTISILYYMVIGTACPLFFFVGKRLNKLNKPDAPFMSPIYRFIGKGMSYVGAGIFYLMTGIYLTIYLIAYKGKFVALIWQYTSSTVITFIFGLVLGSLSVAPIVLRLIPGWERSEGLSDVEKMVKNFRLWKEFNPLPFINLNKGCFIGKSEDTPIYIPWQKIQETHMQVLGTTGSGKGVAMSLVGYQCALAGESVIWLDPKFDRYSPRILRNAAQKSGKPFIFINLNPDQPPQLNVLAGAETFEIEELFVAGFDLRNKGTDGDYHRGRDEDAATIAASIATEKGLNSLPELLTACSSVKSITEQENFWRRFRKLADLPAVNTRTGINLQNAINDGAVIYIVGSTDNERVKMLQKMVLLRVMQIIKKRNRLDNNQPICVVLDEFKHLISNSTLTALGVVRDFDAHFILAHQSLGDLHECPGIDPAASYGAVVDNTAIKILYRIGDAEFAERLAKSGGLKRIFEESVNKCHGDKNDNLSNGHWREAQAFLISPDLINHLPVPSDRSNQASVGVLFGIGNAKVFHVGPVKTNGPLPEPVEAESCQPAGVPHAEDMI